MNYLQPNEAVLGRYQQAQFNLNKVMVGVKPLITLDHCTEYLECEWWIYKLYYPSMKSITIAMEEYRVLLVGKIIDRFKNGVLYVALLSHVTVNEFNEMSLSDVRRF